jgi:hypothetical protein
MSYDADEACHQSILSSVTAVIAWYVMRFTRLPETQLEPICGNAKTVHGSALNFCIITAKNPLFLFVKNRSLDWTRLILIEPLAAAAL